MSRKSKGKRYTDKEKAQVVAFVEKTNAEHGRGGITVASKKFGITPLSISNWMKKAGVRTTRSNVHFASNLRRLADIHESISKKEAELLNFQREYAALKKKL
jgi:transposase-like protein